MRHGDLKHFIMTHQHTGAREQEIIFSKINLRTLTKPTTRSAEPLSKNTGLEVYHTAATSAFGELNFALLRCK